MKHAFDVIERLGGPPPRTRAAAGSDAVADGASGAARGGPLVVEATAAQLAAYRALRRAAFVDDQGLFAGDDADEHDGADATITLVAVAPTGEVLGGVRAHPEDAALGWWRGSRLVAADGRIGAQLVRAACARVATAGAVRFDAHVQERLVRYFARLGWERLKPIAVAGRPHALMHFPVTRFAEAAATKAPLGALVGDALPRDRWRGDDGVPVPGADVVTCVDAIVPAMVERDPEWAGWCGLLVTAHDLAAMGAEPLGALDALGARDRAHAEAVLAGVKRGADAFDLPLLGGHTQLGVPGALAVTGLGRARDPIPASGGRAGDPLHVTADLGGGWRPGYRGRQWDSSTHRTGPELRAMLDAVRHARPGAAKDVSMAGLVGTVGMLAEASGTGAELRVADIPRPAAAELADWLTCFPGFAMVTTAAVAAPATAARRCGTLTREPGVRLRWPDGERTTVLPPAITGLGC